MTNKSVFKYTDQASTSGTSKKVEEMSISAIKEMALLAMQYDDAISMSWGLPPFKTPQHVRQGAIKALEDNSRVGLYSPTHGLTELREALVERLEKDRNWKLDPNKNIIVTAGAMEGIALALNTLIDPEDEVILTDPGFASHLQQIKLAGGKAVSWKLDESQGWALDIEKLEEIISDKTKVIIINSPCNPVGSMFSKEQLDKVADIAIENDLYIISDEPYDFLVYDDSPEFYSIAMNEKIRDRLVLARSFSKEYAMTGWRVGYVAASEGLRNDMLKVHDSLVICAPTISQFAAIAALKGPQDVVEEFRLEFQERRELFFERIEQIPELFECVKPQGAYYTFPKFKVDTMDSYEFAMDLLEKVQVVVVPGEAFGAQGKDHVRMTFCETKDKINEGFDRIEDYIKKYLNN